MFSGRLARIIPGQWELDMDTKLAVLDGLADPNTIRSTITPKCSTGRCWFPSHNGITHTSIGLCSKCINIALWVREAERTYQYQNGTNGTTYTPWLVLPNDSGIGGGSSLPENIINVSDQGTIFDDSRTDVNDSLLEAFDDSVSDIFRASILNISVITFTNNNCDYMELASRQRKCSNHAFDATYPYLDYLEVAATACFFYPCVRDYHGSVVDAIFQERVVKETPIRKPQAQPGNLFPNFVHHHTPCLGNGSLLLMT
jgi:hypothetical protein